MPDAPARRRLPRRDLILLPLIVVLTVIAATAPAEFLARRIFPHDEVDRCAPGAASTSFHALPDCDDAVRTAEGVWAAVRYNGCGYRTAEPCGAKPRGTLRVAVLGSSTASGYLTPYDDTMAARAGRALTRRCRRPVEFQNLGAKGNRGARLEASARAALGLDPDAALLVVSETDLQLMGEAAGPHPAAPRPGATNPMRRLKDMLANSRLLYMESYALLDSDDNYVPMYLRSGGNADFMRRPLSAAWRARLAELERSIGAISATMRGRGVPLIVLYTPQRAQAAIAARARLADGTDPRLLPRAIAALAARHGAGFADGLDDIPAGAPSSRYFYAINGHPNAAGHELFARTIVAALTRPGSGPFADCAAGRTLQRP